MSDTVGGSREPIASGRKASDSSKGAITSGGPVGGASTGSPAAPTAAASSNYYRDRSKYNVATGTGFTSAPKDESANQSQVSSNNPPHPPASVGIGSDTPGKDSSGTSSGPGAGMASGSGRSPGIKGTIAGIHGAGESIRGTVGAAIDRAFNDQEGVTKNEAIVREGESEVRTGQFSKSTKEREGLGQGR